ncbi:MAG: DUF1343 domain-containing protein [Candidatus Babeliales bacterium]|nr:DUF1343 domain-containing protein [Candidatus Babeliales bacterium]
MKMLLFLKSVVQQVFLLFKILFIFAAIFCIPKFFLLYAPTDKVVLEPKVFVNFKLGLENIPKKLMLHLKFGKNGNPLNIGLITNQTGIDQAGKRNIDLLIAQGYNITTLYGPEHGISGKALADKKVDNTLDEKTSLPVVSLYLGNSRFRKFVEKDLKDIDAFIFDMQDSGMRHYTYISVLFKMMEIAAEFDKEFIVLDRPNPLGYVMEGPLVSSEYLSFISIAPVPLRHAMTIGEIAKYFKKFRIKKPIRLTVAPMQDYNRTQGLNNKLPMFLSPNIKTLDSCFGYSFLCILGEGIRPFNVGVGTDKAFQNLVLPNSLEIPLVRWYELRKLLPSKNVKTNITACEKDGEKYSGVKIKIENINEFSAFNTLVDICQFFKSNGMKFTYSPTFNKLVGTDKLRSFLDGKITRKQMSDCVNTDLEKFYEDTKDLFIYHPFPKIILAK